MHCLQVIMMGVTGFQFGVRLKVGKKFAVQLLLKHNDMDTENWCVEVRVKNPEHKMFTWVRNKANFHVHDIVPASRQGN